VVLVTVGGVDGAVEVGVGNAVDLWDIARGAKAQRLEGHTDHVMSVAVSSNGQTLASASMDRTLVLWDVARRARAGILHDTSEGVGAFAFSPDGRTLATTNHDQEVIIREFDVGSWQRRLCSIASRDLTAAEWRDLLPEEPYRKTCG
jgi:WD40 repeat protein